MPRPAKKISLNVKQVDISNEQLLDDTPSKPIEGNIEEPQPTPKQKAKKVVTVKTADDVPPIEQPKLRRTPNTAWTETVKHFKGIKKKGTPQYEEMMKYYQDLKAKANSQ